ncbi:MAG: phage antirepressor [Alkalibacterium sp.]|jgi:anti-repressor protein|uniref:Phage antirepressor n=2 Tax=Lactococcus lactis TaxID=1358 RepID=A0A1V0P3J9_LACLL|nr:phage antirepressor [Lactococcus lactis]MDN6024081.1 phage antirepressor [Lactobacillus sp.]MDN6244651.1 phage antirepressor [Tetragenococcus koreensis]MDN6385481.1 phage antirepressor [Alkalibacterium sp.]ARE21277.1 phage antirepressor [Lactococcus lactis subsp. lactis]MDN5615873.1 phage antirepressor [Lactococcus lactis]
MKELQNFNFNNLPVRTVLIDDESWFVAKDVADILEYSDTQAMTRRLDKEDIMTDKLSGMNMKSTIINESGLYEAIIGSKKKEVKPFKRWITHEVLPTIRKHGAYMTDAKLEEVLLNPDTLINLATQLKEERQARLGLEKENSQLNLELAAATEKTTYLDLILESPDDILITQIAQDYGFSAVKFNRILNELRIQRKVNKQWVLYSRYMGKGYIGSRTQNYVDSKGQERTSITTTWKQKGRKFLYETLKKHGYLPLVEQDDLAS